MMGRIRWNYVGPRLTVILLVAATLHYGLPPLVRRSFTSTVQAVIGAKVEVGEVQCLLPDTRIVARNLAVADPQEPLANLLTADLLVLEVEPGSLARKRMVVRRGLLRGVRFGTSRTRSGALEEQETDTSLVSRFASTAAERGKEWICGYCVDLGATLEKDLRHEFQSIGLAEEMVARWPQAYQRYYSRVQDLLMRGRATDATIREARTNPLRHLAELREAAQEVDQLNRDLGELLEELDQLQRKFASDREAVWNAWQADRQRLEEGVALDEVDAQAVSDYLLQEEVAGRVGTVVRWIQRVRSMVPSSGDDLREPAQKRGADVLFAGLRRRPDFLIRSLELHGTARAGGETLDVTGSLIGLTTQPSIYGRPTIVKIAGRGTGTLDIDASFDRTTDEPVDHLVVRYSGPARPPTDLGRPEAFSFALGEGRDELEADLTLRESAVEGSILVTMHTRGLQVSTKRTATPRLADFLNDSLADVRRIETKLHLTGSLHEPTLRLESTLGKQVLAAVQSSAQREVAARRQALEDTLEERIQAKLDEAERLADNHRREVEQRLSEQQTTLIRLAADTVGMGDRPTLRLGSGDAGFPRRPPHDSTFQR